jgi:hypothetical protein
MNMKKKKKSKINFILFESFDVHFGGVGVLRERKNETWEE